MSKSIRIQDPNKLKNPSPHVACAKIFIESQQSESSSSSSSSEESFNIEDLNDIDDNVISLHNDELDQGIPEESKISKKLSDSTTKAVVMMVLALLFILAICSIDAYTDTVTLHE